MHKPAIQTNPSLFFAEITPEKPFLLAQSSTEQSKPTEKSQNTSVSGDKDVDAIIQKIKEREIILKKFQEGVGNNLDIKKSGSTAQRVEVGPLSNFPIIGDLPLPGQIAVIAGLSIGLLGCSIPVIQITRKSLRNSNYFKDFDATTGKQIQKYTQKDSKSLTWYDQPRWGQRSALQHLLKAVYQPPVPEGANLLHHREFEKITPLSQKAANIDDEKFTGKEFVTYLRVRTPFSEGPNKDRELHRSAELLRVALAAKEYFEQVWQVEFRYLSSRQQEYYKFVDDLLSQKIYGSPFRQKLYDQLDVVLPEVISEEGQNALRGYVAALDKLSETEFGLELLSLFKQYQLADYVVLKTIDLLFGKLKKQDLADDKIILAEVLQHFDMFEKLAPIIQMPSDKSDPENFAHLMHFRVLEVKHRASFIEFEKLMAVLEQWVKPYQAIIKLRSEYTPQDYRQPQEFCLAVPGMDLYQKYARWLQVG